MEIYNNYGLIMPLRYPFRVKFAGKLLLELERSELKQLTVVWHLDDFKLRLGSDEKILRKRFSISRLDRASDKAAERRKKVSLHATVARNCVNKVIAPRQFFMLVRMAHIYTHIKREREQPPDPPIVGA